jgi:tRNA-dihydrouridine synthase 3
MMTTDEVKPEPETSIPGEDVALSSKGAHNGNAEVDADVKMGEPASPKKRNRTNSQDAEGADTSVKRVKGVAPIKAECAILLKTKWLTC